MRLVGVTGTNGKTTTSQLLDSIFQVQGKKTGAIGTIGIFYPSGKEEASHLSNPMATELFAIGQKMKAEGVENIIMEVTSHGLAFERNHALDFDVAIFTNLSQDHLDFHGSLEAYKQSKLKHFAALGQGQKNAYALINLDDDIAKEVLGAISPSLLQKGKVRVLTYGVRNPQADLAAYPKDAKGDSTLFEVRLRGEPLLDIQLPMPGLFNVYNALAAFGAAFSLGVGLDQIQKGLASSRAVEGRFEKLNLASPFPVYIDYAHTPDSLAKILHEVKNLTPGRLIVVFGCGGERDRGKRPLMGKAACAKAEVLILTSDNPRSEDPTQINQDILRGIELPKGSQLYQQIDRRQAIHLALGMAGPKDAVVIAGKGHETYQQIGQKKIPFSDRGVALEFFQGVIQPTPQRAVLELNLQRLGANWKKIMQDKPQGLKIMHVVKDDALGIGMLPAAKAAIQAGCDYLGVAFLEEALELRQGGIRDFPIFVFGERTLEELTPAITEGLSIQIQSLERACQASEIALSLGKILPVHLKVDTGMGRYGVPWEQAKELFLQIQALPGLRLEGLMTHLAQSDERDKTFAKLQLRRFAQVVDALTSLGKRPPLVHACNSGGYLDLPQGHFDLVRLGILPSGVYPSKVCRRLESAQGPLQPVMSLKTKIAYVQELRPGDSCGYGMHFKAERVTRIAVLPLGYGDGYPRLRNAAQALVHGALCPQRGGNSMDAMLIEVTDLPEAKIGDEVILLGEQKDQTITVMQVADWAKTVTYDVMSCWTKRLPRSYI